MVTYTSVRCTACNGRNAKADPFYYDWGDRCFGIYRCPDCTHQFVYPPVSPTDQAAIYGDNYFSSGGDWACGIFAGGYADSEAQLVEEAHQILDMLPIQAGRLLDIGCAGGVFLNEARTRGFSVQGIELN
jgi:2-polyprenyl-3-methyl-5-hydroxy-6-metoxy-1,4-benzoquinol methylase